MGLMKVQWQHQKDYKWTWAPDEEICEHYPRLFTVADFKDEI